MPDHEKSAGSRPRNLEQMTAAFRRLCTEEGFGKGLRFRPKSTDIIISPYVKNGTTWMQQIVHGLRSGGSIDFDEILQVIPWIELAYDMGVDIDAAQGVCPRAYKSHLPWEMVPKGGRYIVVFRDPMDSLTSMHRFLDGWMFEKGSISLADYAGVVLDRSLGWWEHAVSWWRQRHSSDILMVTFDKMKDDLDVVVNQVADFMDKNIASDVRQLASRQASFDFMKRFERKFDDHLLRARRNDACGLPSGGAVTKVSNGRSGDGIANLPRNIVEAFTRRWDETMLSEFGFKSYSDFANSVNERRLQ